MEERAIFTRFPALKGKVPFIQLATLPTPLTFMEKLSSRFGAEIWVKRDGLTHPVYGGNKIRKFEFIFADILRRKARVVITGGALGSHHTLATAVIAHQFGIKAVCCYFCEPIGEEVRRNLLMSVPLGIEAHFCGDYPGLALSFIWQYLRHFSLSRKLPYFIYPGASGTLGILGYVNAALEIKEQLDTMNIPEPEAIFVAVGSCGTFAGLLLGARLANLKSRIIGVRVIEESIANRPKVARMVNRTVRFLRKLDPGVPPMELKPDEIILIGEYLGPGYAHPTPESSRAVELTAELEGLPLETTYTGKTMAALLDYARANPRSRLLFLDTFAEKPSLKEGDYRLLPRRFWPVFNPSHRVPCWCITGWLKPGYCWKKSITPREGF
ncbi:MAG: pyridoxal-phosphate dependent enzyme [Anaerolineae bacterium]|nr:pyridoxal-phosphate dependent enzyme [Anaerolineae bacterium]MDW8101813.1 pyridoxal-phosphate dependent enzyme [Anaerolineae bacterium]